MGHVISGEGVATDPTKVAAVREWPAPNNVAELRSFLGLASHYRRFIKGFATITAPLHQLIQKGRDFQWSKDCATAFSQLRSALTEAPVLDASNAGVGAVLSQEGEHGEQVIAYFSCTLSKPEKNYCVT